MSSPNQRILFLCTGNSCRSQMAEGFARALHGDRFEAHSAGTDPHGMNSLAIRAMAEAGIDISSHWSKRISDLGALAFDHVITVCDSASEACPTFPGPGRPQITHVPFQDPPALAANARTDEEAMPHYRRVRDEIRAFIEELPRTLNEPAPRPAAR